MGWFVVAISGTVDAPEPQAARPSEIEAGDVHIWCVDVERRGPVDDSCLDQQEREQADRFHFARHANAYRCAHVMRRSVLGGYLGLRPNELKFETEAHGRPRLSTVDRNPRDFRFNATSSLPLSLLAVTASGQVGVDVECLRAMPDAAQIAATQFHPEEARQITGRTGADDRHDAFFRCWTRKEAVVKAMGTGLYTDLDIFVVGAEAESSVFQPRFVGQPNNAGKWWLMDLSRPPIYCALALSCRPKRVWIGSWFA